MSQVLNRFYRLLNVLAAVAMVSSFVAVMLGVLGRQFDFNIRGLDAYAGYAIGAALFLALPETFQRGEHIRVTLLLQKLPERWRVALEYWGLLSGLALASFLAWYACRLVLTSREFNDVSQMADASPLWIPQIAMALGCLGWALSFLHALVARITGTAFFAQTDGDIARVE